jgi:hypothetical protein
MFIRNRFCQAGAVAQSLTIAVTGILFANIASAQEGKPITFDVGGGFTSTLGHTSLEVNDGWNVTAGVGVNFSRFIGAKVDVAYNRFDISGNALQNAGFPGGNVQVFSATLNPVVHLLPGRHFDLYATGGGGLYRFQQDFTQPTLAYVGGFDPFFGFYSAVVPATQVVTSYSVNKPGVDAGAGIAFGTRYGKFFAEARYNRIIFGNERHVDYVPVSFGFRF